jgi:hypothetical protein
MIPDEKPARKPPLPIGGIRGEMIEAHNELYQATQAHWAAHVEKTPDLEEKKAALEEAEEAVFFGEFDTADDALFSLRMCRKHRRAALRELLIDILGEERSAKVVAAVEGHA